MTLILWAVGLFIAGSIIAGVVGSVIEVSIILKDIKKEKEL